MTRLLTAVTDVSILSHRAFRQTLCWSSFSHTIYWVNWSGSHGTPSYAFDVAPNSAVSPRDHRQCLLSRRSVPTCERRISVVTTVTTSSPPSVLGSPGYAICLRCGVRTLVARASEMCSYCLDYEAVRKGAAKLTNVRAYPSQTNTVPSKGKADPFDTGVRPYQTNMVLGKRKADALRESRKLLPIPPCTEFQTRSGMYDVLLSTLKTFYKTGVSSRTPPPYLLFHGSYSIIADPKVSNARQLLLVSQDLQKIVKLPHQ